MTKKPIRWKKRSLYAATFILSAFAGAGAQLVLEQVFAFRNNVRPEVADIAKMQPELWNKNSECALTVKGELISLSDGQQMMIQNCPSGDILVTKFVNPLNSTFVWIPKDVFDRSLMSQEHALFNLPVDKAYAATVPQTIPNASPPELSTLETTHLAQSFTVICIKQLGDGKVLRRIKLDDGTCVDQTINAYNGTVISNTTVACDSACG